MDPRIDKIIDRLLDDCLQKDVKLINYEELSEKDLLTITQNFLEFTTAKMTRTSISDKGSLPPLPYPEEDTPKIEKNN